MELLLTETCSKKFRLTEISMLHQKLFHPIACHLVQDFWENLHTRNYSPLLLNMLWESLEIWPFFFIHIHMNPITTNPKGYRNSRWLTPNLLYKIQIFQIAVLDFVLLIMEWNCHSQYAAQWAQVESELVIHNFCQMGLPIIVQGHKS
jgi:hypothetical protein